SSEEGSHPLRDAFVVFAAKNEVVHWGIAAAHQILFRPGLGQGSGEMLMNDQPLSAALLPNRRVSAIEFHCFARFALPRQVEGFRGPHNRASAADLEIIVRGEFELKNRSQTIVHVHVKANKLAERLAGAFLVLFPSVVFQWRDVIERSEERRVGKGCIVRWSD